MPSGVMKGYSFAGIRATHNLEKSPEKNVLVKQKLKVMTSVDFHKLISYGMLQAMANSGPYS